MQGTLLIFVLHVLQTFFLFANTFFKWDHAIHPVLNLNFHLISIVKNLLGHMWVPANLDLSNPENTAIQVT